MKRIMLLVSSVALLCGCTGGNDDTGPLQPSPPPVVNDDCFDDPYSCEIRPLAISNTWTYYEYRYTNDGQFTGRDSLVYTIVRDTTVNSEIAYIDSAYVYESAYLALWMNRSDGLWIYSERSDSLELVYHYPTYAGDWYAFFDYGVITRVISTDTVICLGQECYRCYCYLLDYQFGEKEYYFLAPGIGLVMHEKNLITNAQPFGPLALRVRTDLVKYHIE